VIVEILKRVEMKEFYLSLPPPPPPMCGYSI